MNSNGSDTADRSILLVDDDPAIVRYLRHGFERRGYRVTTATDGVDAIELLRKQSFDGLAAAALVAAETVELVGRQQLAKGHAGDVLERVARLLDGRQRHQTA